MVVAPQPTVSVITPTFNRHELLVDRCIPSILNQTYAGMIEHVVVSDAPDWNLATYFADGQYDSDRRRLVYGEMEHHDPNVYFGNRARLRALEKATGEFILYLDDDNAWRPQHVGLMVAALGMTGADFAYSQMFRHPHGDVVGLAPSPRYGQLDSSILAHRAGIRPVGWNPGKRADPDWEAVEAWLRAGCTWVHVPQITCDYYMRGCS